MKPNWEELRGHVLSQSGWFHWTQAQACGFTRAGIRRLVKKGVLEDGLPDTYFFHMYPIEPFADLVCLWLWSKQTGIISHETALARYHISDALPARYHLTLPVDAAARYAKRPTLSSAYLIYGGTWTEKDWQWFEGAPITTPARTLCDLAAVNGDPILIEQGLVNGLKENLFRIWDVAPVVRYLTTFCAKPG